MYSPYRRPRNTPRSCWAPVSTRYGVSGITLGPSLFFLCVVIHTTIFSFCVCVCVGTRREWRRIWVAVIGLLFRYIFGLHPAQEMTGRSALNNDGGVWVYNKVRTFALAQQQQQQQPGRYYSSNEEGCGGRSLSIITFSSSTLLEMFQVQIFLHLIVYQQKKWWGTKQAWPQVFLQMSYSMNPDWVNKNGKRKQLHSQTPSSGIIVHRTV